MAAAAAAAAEGWFLSCLQKAYVNQSPFHALFTAVKLGYAPNASTAKTQFYTLSGVSRDCPGAGHAHTAEGFSFALWRQVRVSLAYKRFALENLLFAIQCPHKDTILSPLRSVWRNNLFTCLHWPMSCKYLLTTYFNIATTEVGLCATPLLFCCCH